MDYYDDFTLTQNNTASPIILNLTVNNLIIIQNIILNILLNMFAFKQLNINKFELTTPYTLHLIHYL